MSHCPCGSQNEYLDCCGLLIEQQNPAASPEALMRSRYTAYTQGRIDYIKKTMRGKPLLNFNEADALTWAKQVKWKGLEVVMSYIDEQDETIGYVEFIASFEDQGKRQSIHELSQFQLVEGQWFYTDGSQPKAKQALKKPQVPRNAPCPCGSQKKYKNCHGLRDS